MASGLWGFGLYTELKEPLLANYVSFTQSHDSSRYLSLIQRKNLSRNKVFEIKKIYTFLSSFRAPSPCLVRNY